MATVAQITRSLASYSQAHPLLQLIHKGNLSTKPQGRTQTQAMIKYTSYAKMTEADYNQFLKEFYKENGPKPVVYEVDDLYEDDRFNLY